MPQVECAALATAVASHESGKPFPRPLRNAELPELTPSGAVTRNSGLHPCRISRGG